MNKLTADARHHDQHELTGRRRPGLEAAGGFLPRVIYGVIADVAIFGMEFFQFAGEGVNIGGGERTERTSYTSP